MNLELGKTYRLRNGTLGLVEELLGDGTFYGTVTAPPTDLRVRVIWDKDGLSTKRGTAWDLVEEVPVLTDDETTHRIYPGPDHLKPVPIGWVTDLSRIATALERIADALDRAHPGPGKPPPAPGSQEWWADEARVAETSPYTGGLK